MRKPLNLLLTLDDGRHLCLRFGSGQSMIARQKKPGPAIVVGEIVKTTAGKDGRKAVLECVKRTKKDCTFLILGSCDGDDKAPKEAE